MNTEEDPRENFFLFYSRPSAGPGDYSLPTKTNLPAASSWTGYASFFPTAGQPVVTSLAGPGGGAVANPVVEAETGVWVHTYFQGINPAALDAAIEANELTLHHIWPAEERRRGYFAVIHRLPEPVTIALCCAGVLGILLLLKPRRPLPAVRMSPTATKITK